MNWRRLVSCNLVCRLIRIAILVMGIISGACDGHTAPPAPPSVPPSAEWVGGSDGGAFIDCMASENQSINTCTVYNDQTGDVWMSGAFVRSGGKSGVLGQDLKYSGADGANIYLSDGSVLVPIAPEKPANVPPSAVLSQNGIYLNCVVKVDGTFNCEMYLAANGQRIAGGRYRLRLGPAQLPITPRIVTASRIYLESGEILELM